MLGRLSHVRAVWRFRVLFVVSIVEGFTVVELEEFIELHLLI
jgi:hypothetical protein